MPFKKGYTPWNKGGTLSVEHRQKASDSLKGRILSEEHKDNIAKALKGKPKSEEHKKKLRVPKSEEAKKNNSLSKKGIQSGENNPFYGKHHTEEVRQKMREDRIGKKRTEESRNKQSNTMKQNWEDKEFSTRMIKSWKMYPNKAELSLQDIINSIFFEGQFIYVGDGKEVIGRKIPDFIDKTNHKIIELYGDFWHQNHDPNDRINYFKDLGYNTLVIWEHELQDVENLKTKLLEFIC